MRRDALIISAVLLALILVEFIFPIRAPVADFNPASVIDGATGSQGEIDSVALPEPPAVAHYDAMLQRPLFIESRRVPGVDAGTAADTTVRASGRPAFKLMGIIREKNATYAMIASPKKGGSSGLMKVGDTRDGWKVQEIADDRLVVVSGTERHELLLRTYKPVQPTASNNKSRALKKKGQRRKATKAKKSTVSSGRPNKAKQLRNRFKKRDK